MTEKNAPGPAAASTNLTFGERKLVLHNGDILDLQADALVCPVDPHFSMDSGLPSIIARAAGKTALVQRPLRPEPYGKVTVLPGGKLKAKYLFLTVVMGERGADKMRHSIQQAVDRSIRYAEFLRLKSIAFPMLGSAQSLPPYTLVAHMMMENVARYFRRRNTKLKLIQFSLHNPDAYKAFQSEAENWSKH